MAKGGAREYAGRKGDRRAPISARVSEKVLDDLKEAAETDGVSLSAKAAEVLTNWSNRRKKH